MAVPKVKKPTQTETNSMAAVPDRQYAREYISREIDGVRDLDVLTYAFQKAMNVLIYGPTGPGKTSMVLAWAARNGKRFYSVASNLALDPSQMFGKMSVKDDGTFGWFDGGVTEIVRTGGVILINEVNFMPPRIATVLFELLDKRREISLLDHKGEKVRAHRPSCWCDLPAKECEARWVLVVADMNPGYAGTSQLNAAFRNRFPVQFEIDYNPLVEEKLVFSSTLRKIVTAIRTQVGRTVDTPVTTNMMMEFETIATGMGVAWAVTNFVNHFDTEERDAIRAAFNADLSDLEDDFKPEAPAAAAWNQFEGKNADWMEDGEDEDDDDAEDWESDLNDAWNGK